MAGHASNWYKPTAGPLKGRAVYLSKAQQAGMSRLQVEQKLRLKSSAVTKQANTARPSGVALSASVVAPVPVAAPALPRGAYRMLSGRVVTAAEYANMPYSMQLDVGNENALILSKERAARLAASSPVAVALPVYGQQFASPAAMDAWGRKQWASLYKKLDPEVEEMASQYQQEAFDMNALARTGKPTRNVEDTPFFASLNTALDKAIAHPASRVPANVQTYRGVAENSAFTTNVWDKLKVGDTFSDKGFVSTSLNRKHAERFANNEDTDKRGTGLVMTVRVPKKTRAVYVDGLPTALGPNLEWELVMGRNTTFRVVSMTRNPDGSREGIVEIV